VSDDREEFDKLRRSAFSTTTPFALRRLRDRTTALATFRPFRPRPKLEPNPSISQLEGAGGETELAASGHGLP
jgi:hypothetical protein